MEKNAPISNKKDQKGQVDNNASFRRLSPFFGPLVQPKLTINEPGDSYEQEADAVADKVMRMQADGPSPFFSPIRQIQRMCAHCEEEQHKMQRKEMNDGETDVGNQLESYTGSLDNGGSSLPTASRGFFESRMGYDFGQVKIHADAAAAKSANAINALAYTSGNHIVFNEGQYSPETDNGKRLLAHELTHVIQQNSGIQKKIQRDCFSEERPNRTMSTCPEGSSDVGRQAQGQSNARDAKANAIIAAAQNATTPLQDRAMQVVNDIICAYMPSQASKVRKLLYFATESGLHTRSVGSGSSAQGDICVGDYFVNNTTNAGISRRVLQVAHELEHIDQYRSGMTGGTRSDEREFLAFYDESLADEFIGTGRMSDNTRKSLIDGAIGYYYCLDAALQTQYASRLQTLLTRRQTVNGTAGNAPTNPPTSCRRQ